MVSRRMVAGLHRPFALFIDRQVCGDTKAGQDPADHRELAWSTRSESPNVVSLRGASAAFHHHFNQSIDVVVAVVQRVDIAEFLTSRV